MFHYQQLFKRSLQAVLGLSSGLAVCFLFSSPVFSQIAQSTNERNSEFLFKDVPITASRICPDVEIKTYIKQLDFPSQLAISKASYYALVSQCKVSAVPALIEALKSQRENIRANAALAIGEIGTKAIAAIPALIDVLDDESNAVRLNISDVSGVLNLGAISGDVTNAIGQLPSTDEPDKPGLKELLTQLQGAIEAETQLSQEDKAEALEQVKVLAEAGQKPQDGPLKKMANTALKVLKGTVASLPEATKLVETCSKLLPIITKLLGVT